MGGNNDIRIPSLAADSSFTDPEARDFPTVYHEVDTDPKKGEAIRKYVDNAQSVAQKNFGTQPIPHKHFPKGGP